MRSDRQTDRYCEANVWIFTTFPCERTKKIELLCKLHIFYLLYSVVIKRFKVWLFSLGCRPWPAHVLAIRKRVRYRQFRLRHKYLCGDLSSGKKLTGKWFIRHWPADLCDRRTVWSLDYKSDMFAQPDSYKMQSDPNLEYSDLDLPNRATLPQ